jgi:hypothetical protein
VRHQIRASINGRSALVWLRMRLEQKRNDIGIHHYRRCGIHQRATGRELSLRSARMRATNSLAPSGSYSVSVFRSSRLTGGLRTRAAESRTRSAPVSALRARCGISIQFSSPDRLGVIRTFYGHSDQVEPLNSAPDGGLPPDQEKVAAAKTAPLGLNEPMKGSLDGVSHTHRSKLDGSAMRTARGEQTYCGT